MKRKINRVGTSTLTVSLPSRWVKENGLSKGDEIDLNEEGGNLVISSTGTNTSGRVELDVSEYGNMVGRVVGALYKSGYSEFKLTFNDPKTSTLIEKELSKGFFGLDFVHKGKHHCVLRSMANVDPGELDTSIRRIFWLVQENAKEAYEAIKERDFEALKLVAKKDVNINKFADFARRLLNIYGSSGKRDTSMLYFIVEELENVGDKYKYLAEHISENDVGLSEDVQDIFNKLINFIDQFSKLFYSFSAEKYRKFGESYKSLCRKINNVRKNKEGEDLLILVKLDSILQAVFDLNGPLLTLHLG
ncbi:MAG: AbrB/MazE/SpoVT family DNA-binding domain-containing protein [Nanobdellota archaeon]